MGIRYYCHSSGGLCGSSLFARPFGLALRATTYYPYAVVALGFVLCKEWFSKNFKIFDIAELDKRCEVVTNEMSQTQLAEAERIASHGAQP